MNTIIERKKENIPDKLNTKALQGLIDRVTKNTEYFEKTVFVKTESQFDAYRLYGNNGKIVIEANNTVAAASAFNRYLNDVCGCSFGPITKNIALPKEPPIPLEVYEEKSVFIYRYFMNYCTFSYTYLFSDWEDYERLIDWMALSGINLALNIVGHEIVERDMLLELGYSHEEILKYLAGPAYLPWQWMGNLTGFAGPLPKWWFDRQKNLSSRINERMSEFGIGVMMPGFFGLVPIDFNAKFPNCEIYEQGMWCDAFERQPLLSEKSMMFDKVSEIFYRKTKEHFGDIRYFSGDPFHEGGNADGVDIKSFSKSMCKNVKKVSENAVWFFQGWLDNPKADILSGFKKEDVIVGFLTADKLYSDFKGYNGYPWLYMSTPNFGGTRKLDGNIDGIIAKPFEAVSRDDSLIGIGMTMEGIELDEILFYAFSKTSIRTDKIDSSEFADDFVKARYGYINSNLKEIYSELIRYVYKLTDYKSYRGRESVLCARPNLNVHTVSYWSEIKNWYDSEILYDITQKMLLEYDALKDNECYITDIIELARQLNSEIGHEYLDKFSDAWNSHDLPEYLEYSEKFMRLFDNAEELMMHNKKTTLASWLEKADLYAKNEEEKRIFRFNALNLIVLWASKDGAVSLRDYAYREWSGLILFYKKRWQTFFENLENGGKAVDWADFDYEFILDSLDKNFESSSKKPLKDIISGILKLKE